MIRKKLGTAAGLVFAAVAVVAGLGTLRTIAQTPPKATDPRAPLGGFTPAERTLAVFPLRTLSPEKAAKELETFTAAAVVPVADRRALLIYADAKTHAEIDTALWKLGETRAVPVVVKLRKAKADETAAKLNTLLKHRDHPNAMVFAVPGEATLLALVDQDGLARMFTILKDFGESQDPVTTTFALKNASADEVARALNEVFNGPGKPGRVRVTADQRTNSVVVFASPTDSAAVRELLDRFDTKPERQFSVSFNAVQWSDVLDWYAKETGLTLASAVRPTGTVTLTPGKGKMLTLGEVTDLLNELLMQQKFLLVRRERSFFIQPLDERLDRDIFRRVGVNELPKLGKSELVEVVLPLADFKMTVKGDAAEIKKMLGPYGQMDTVEARNTVVVREAAGNVERLLRVIRPRE